MTTDIDEAIAVVEATSDFDTSLATRTVKFRGVSYTLRELPIGEHRKIEKQATRKKVDEGGNEVDDIDGALQNQLMLSRSMVSPKRGEPGWIPIDKMGTALYLSLQREMQQLHYQPEVDELAKKAAKNGKSKTDEEEKEPGNA